MAAVTTQAAADLLTETEQVVEGRVVRVGERPIPFEQFLEMAEGQWLELVDGVIVEKQPVTQLDHELCSAWLYQVLGPYVKKRGLGLMLGSRIMVRADDFGGRMPDLLFVRAERLNIVQQKAVYGAPDLVIEIVSPGDRPPTCALSKPTTPAWACRNWSLSPYARARYGACAGQAAGPMTRPFLPPAP